MSDTIEVTINIDALRIADFPLIMRAGRGELEPERLVELVERISPGASNLPIRYLRVIMQRLAESLQDEQKN